MFLAVDSQLDKVSGVEPCSLDWAFASQHDQVPRSYEQILSLPAAERERWLQACREESNSHLSIPSISAALQPGEFTAAAPIRLSWVFAKKPTGEYKARIVMMGQHMREGVHFNNTHAPVPTPTIIRLFFALVAAEARDFTQLDVKTAFLTAPLDIELDVILPNGFGRGRGMSFRRQIWGGPGHSLPYPGVRKEPGCGGRSCCGT